MNKIESLIRIAILVILMGVSLLLIINIEDDESTLDFVIHALLDKGFGFLGFYIFHLLYTRWKKSDPWIAAYDRFATKGMDAPNPMCKQNKDYWQ